VPVLRGPRRRHVSYGVKDEHYDTVGKALLDTLAHAFGDDFTPRRAKLDRRLRAHDDAHENGRARDDEPAKVAA
jgi:hypothetical protein